MRVLDYNKTREWAEVQNQRGDVGWVPNNHIAPINSLDKFSWSVASCHAIDVIVIPEYQYFFYLMIVFEPASSS